MTANYSPSTNAENLELYGKVQAYAHHRQQNTPQHERPNISRSTLKRAQDRAHEYIYTVLKHLNENVADEGSDADLKWAAQILEGAFLTAPTDTPDRAEELYTAALAYYLSGYYPRAFVLMRQIEADHNTPLTTMRMMFLRQLEVLRENCFKFLCLPEAQDLILSDYVSSGKYEVREAVYKSLQGNLNRVYILFYNFAKSGNDRYLDRAFQLAKLGKTLAIDFGFQDWWWVFYTTSALLKEYQRNSLWTLLQPMRIRSDSQLINEYIYSAFSRQPTPMIDLWRSQSHTIPYIMAHGSYCLKMPTSSGKRALQNSLS